MSWGAIALARLPDVWLVRGFSIALGVAVGIVATAFRVGAERGFVAWSALVHAPPDRSIPGWWLGAVGSAALVVAAVGLTRRLSPEGAGSGIQEVEGVLSGELGAIRWRRVLPVKFFGGLAAMAAGLVLGREGPTIHMGGALGAALTSLSRRAREHLRSFLGAGSAAGLAVAFQAPLGGILFAMEELRRELTLRSLRAQCVVIATITAVLVSTAIAGPVRILPIPIYEAPPLAELALAVPFAVGVAAYGVFLNAAIVGSLDAMRRIVERIGWIFPALLLGAGVGALVFAWPDVTGGGELLAVRLFEEPLAVGMLAALLVARTLLFGLSYAGGTPGGIFAPQLAFGALLGLLFSHALHAVAPDLDLESGRFAVAGMAALLTATVRAPLTGLALVVEMTGNHALIPMLLIVSVVADVTADALGGRPIYQSLLQRTLELRGSHPPS
ncbi:H(+)/Cl(-) exchange transporter ClcA [Myxococcaceae bacterium]|nr:H(+)/Cl(-) exchange transporter ClcA [Myxococcaceae bacterium]